MQLIFLKRHFIIPYEIYCPNCQEKCKINDNNFRCRGKSGCNFCVSIFKGTFLDQTRIPAWKVLLFINSFINKHFSHARVCNNLKITKKTSVDWKVFCSEVCINWLGKQEPIGVNIKVRYSDILYLYLILMTSYCLDDVIVLIESVSGPLNVTSSIICDWL